ncbi:MAG: HEAT repeat domain-containing protein [Granulosicoccus sp.]
MKKPAVALALLAIVATFTLWWMSGNQGSSQIDDVIVNTDKASVTDEATANISSPFAVRDPVQSEPSIIASDRDSAANTSTNAPTASPALLVTQLPVWDKPLSDEQFLLLVRQLKTHPALLQQLVDRFRQETDQDTKLQMARVLGEVGGEQMILLASELIFSGDNDARSLGMTLLQEIQPGNAEARDIVSGMLATEVEPGILVESLTALARPGDVDEQSRAYLSDQVAWLTSHEDEGVRSISLDILSRWSQDGRYTDTLVAGLNDHSEHVRASAAYSLLGHDTDTPVVIERLFATLRSETKSKRVQRATIQALRSMPLTPSQQSELDALELRVNTVIR